MFLIFTIPLSSYSNISVITDQQNTNLEYPFCSVLLRVTNHYLFLKHKSFKFWNTVAELKLKPKQSLVNTVSCLGSQSAPQAQNTGQRGWFTLEKTRLRGDLTAIYKCLKGSSRGAGTLLPLATSDRTQANGMKLHPGTVRLDIRKRCFTDRLVSHWKRVLREVIRHQACQSSESIWMILLIML